MVEVVREAEYEAVFASKGAKEGKGNKKEKVRKSYRRSIEEKREKNGPLRVPLAT